MDVRERSILRTENITYFYRNHIPALAGITMTIKEGEKLAVIGSNGSGKSTLLHILNGLLYPSSGKLFYRDIEISEKSLRDTATRRRFRTGVGYIFQDADVQLFCPTVRDELLFGPLQIGLSDEEAARRTSEVIEMLQIGHLLERPSYMLSGGEKKRVSIASVLVINPEVLILDEPTNDLDPRTEVFLIELMLALNEAGKTIVIATHDLSLVNELDPRVAVLSETHTVMCSGTAEEILKDEELLLKANLIHEHRHYHGTVSHRHIHSHYLFHRHGDAANGTNK